MGEAVARQQRRRTRGLNGADAEAAADADDAGGASLLPAALQTVGRLHKQLSKRNAALYSCLCSIVEDSAFVTEVSQLYPTLPVVANLRAGLWYAAGAWRRQQQQQQQQQQQLEQQREQERERQEHPPPPLSAPPPPVGLTCYFKSTDGHHGCWAFSTSRINWPLAGELAGMGGAVIVDATRRGKRFPDALAKTAPCWCAVLNRAVARVRASGAAAAAGTAGAGDRLRRGGSLPRQPSLSNWAAAAPAAGGSAAPAVPAAPGPLRAVASLTEWLDEMDEAEDEVEGVTRRRRPQDEGGKQPPPEQQQQQQHAILPTLPPLLSTVSAQSLPPLPLSLRPRSPFAAADQGQGQMYLSLPPARFPPQRHHHHQQQQQQQQEQQQQQQEPPGPATPAPPTKRRLPWWHADAAGPEDDEEQEKERDQNQNQDHGDDDDGAENIEDDDDARGQRDDDRAPRHHRQSPADSKAPTYAAAAATAQEGTTWDTALHLPPWIGRSEAAQIEARLDGWVDALLSAAGRPAVEALAARLRKPLRPLWLCQGSRIFTDAVAQPDELPFTPLVLVSASDPRSGRRPLGLAHAALLRRRRRGGGGAGGKVGGLEDEKEENEQESGDDSDDDNKQASNNTTPTAATYEYLPGAGDDEESWARGLTPSLFWENARELLLAGEAGADAAARRVLVRLAGERHHASERDARRAAAGAPGYGALVVAATAGDGGSGGNVNGNTGAAAGAAGAPPANAAAAPWPLGDDVPLLLGGLSAARLPEARASCGALLLVGPSVHASLAPELERTRGRADAWLSAVGGPDSFFSASSGGGGGGPRDDAASSPSAHVPPPDILWLPVGGPKADRCSLTLALGPAIRFVAAHLSLGSGPVLIADGDGASTCVCVAAAALQALFAPDDDGDEADGDDGGENEQENEEEGLIGRRVRLRRGAAEAFAAGAGPLAEGAPPPTRASVRRWVAFAASRYPPARPHRLAVKSVWAFFAAASGSGGRRGLPSQQQQEEEGG